MDLLLILGLVLWLAFVALLVARDFVTRHVTSKSLGSLAPGYAATQRGYNTYAALIGVLGAFLIALYFQIGWLMAFMVTAFIVGTVMVFIGEYRTFRALKR